VGGLVVSLPVRKARPAISARRAFLLSEEMGIGTTSISTTVEVGRLAEAIVGHTLPGARLRAAQRIPAQSCLMSATPLAGLKVIELSHTVMGPTDLCC
jgi:hypothetical protein